MLDKRLLQKLLPLPYVPRRWQAKGIRWWAKLRVPVFVLAALLLIPLVIELFWIVYFALPTAMQLLTAMLVLYGVFLFTYHSLQMYDDPVMYAAIGGMYAMALPAAGIYPDITIWLPVAMMAPMGAMMLRELALDVWTGLHRRIA